MAGNFAVGLLCRSDDDGEYIDLSVVRDVVSEGHAIAVATSWATAAAMSKWVGRFRVVDVCVKHLGLDLRGVVYAFRFANGLIGVGVIHGEHVDVRTIRAAIGPRDQFNERYMMEYRP